MLFYPKDAPVPAELKTAEFVLHPLSTSHVELDYAALMESRKLLRRWSSSNWPMDDFTLANNWEDLAGHEREHQERIAFTYTVLDPGESRCLGCVYIKENDVAALLGGEYEALVRFWVTQPRLDDGLDQRLLETLINWFQDTWAFSRLYFHANEQDGHQVQLLAASSLSYRTTATIPNRSGRYRFYSSSLPSP